MTSQDFIRIGTSGWHYPHWRGHYYPPDLPTDKWLAWYARDFDCVEVNNTFYQLPSAETIAHWCEQTPETFMFTVKASRLITHLKKLKDCQSPLAVFLERITLLGPRLGPILFQLPPRWHINLPRLESFLQLLPNHYQYSFEFRDPSWHRPEVYDLLRSHQIGWCLFDLAGQQAPEIITSNLVYVRLHGPGAAYSGSYDTVVLERWAAKILGWASAGRHVHVFFDNDQAGYAVINAKGLLKLVTYRSPRFRV